MTKQIVELPTGLGLSRDELPQISADKLPEFLQWLSKAGVKSTLGRVTVGTLKPSQGELDMDKVQNLASGRLDMEKPFIVSGDGYILDGHHRWGAAYTQDKDTKARAWGIDLPIKELIPLAKQFPGAFFKSVDESLFTEEEALGTCYQDAAETLVGFGGKMSVPSGTVMVHGRPTLRRPPFIKFGHAWLEKGDTCYDPTIPVKMDRETYYALGNIDPKECIVYTEKAARTWLIVTEHYGPWEGPEGVPPTAAQKKAKRGIKLIPGKKGTKPLKSKDDPFDTNKKPSSRGVSAEIPKKVKVKLGKAEPAFDPDAELDLEEAQLDEAVKLLHRFVKGDEPNEIKRLGTHGWFDVYVVNKIATSSLTDPYQQSRVTTARDLNKLPIEPIKGRQAKSISSGCKEATRRLTKLGFRKMKLVVVFADLQGTRNSITGGGVGGLAYRNEHGVVVHVVAHNMISVSEIDTLVHEWGHMWETLQGSQFTKFLSAWWRENVMMKTAQFMGKRDRASDTVSSQVFNTVTDYFTQHMHRNFDYDHDRFDPKNMEIRAKLMAIPGHDAVDRQVLEGVWRKRGGGSFQCHLRGSYQFFRNVGYEANFEALNDLEDRYPSGTLVTITTPTGDKHRMPEKVTVTVKDLAPFDVELRYIGDHLALRNIAGQFKVTNYQFDRFIDTAHDADGVFGAYESKFMECYLGAGLVAETALTSKVGKDQKILTKYDVHTKHPSFISRLKTNLTEMAGGRRRFSDAVREAFTYAWYYFDGSEANYEDTEYRIGKPEGDDIRAAALNAGITPSSYAAANSAEMWAVLVEYAAKNLRKLSPGMKQLFKAATTKNYGSNVKPMRNIGFGGRPGLKTKRARRDDRMYRAREKEAQHRTLHAGDYGYSGRVGPRAKRESKCESLPRQPSPAVKEFLKNYVAVTYDNPIMSEMRIWSYAIDGERQPMIMTDIQFHPVFGDPDIVWFKTIMSADQPKQGGASKVFKRICDMADKHGVTLVLTPKPFGTVPNKLNKTQLKSWYKRNGFKPWRNGDMIRHPKGKSEALTEASFSSRDVPKFFRVAFGQYPPTEKLYSSLAQGKLDGVTGISDKAEILFQWFGVGVRDAMLVMDGDAVVKANKLSRLMYDNPAYLMSRDMDALYRIWDRSGRSRLDRQGMMKNLLQYTFTKGLAATGYKREARNLAYFNAHDKFATVYADSSIKIHTIKELVQWITGGGAAATVAGLRNWGSGYYHHADLVQQYAKEIPASAWERAVAHALAFVGKTYSDEGEWVMKDKTLRIPKGSQLIFRLPMSLKDYRAYKAGDEEAVRRNDWDSFHREGIERVDSIVAFINRYKLDRLYRVSLVDPQKFDRAKQAHYARKA